MQEGEGERKRKAGRQEGEKERKSERDKWGMEENF